MFRITRDTSSGSSIQCSVKITVILPVDMDVIGVMAVYLPVVRVCTAQCREALSRLCSTHKYAAITPTTSISTD